MMKATLMLEDGRIFSGESIGAPGERIGEVFFNTAVVGYQEMLTDPSNAGKILVLTYPLIGNYGIAPKFNESKKCWLAGLVIKEQSRVYSNWQAKTSLGSFMKQQGLVAMSEVDTRALAVHLRNKAEMPGIISTLTHGPKELSLKIEAFRKKDNSDFIRQISTPKPVHMGRQKAKYRIAVLDLGITASIIRQLENLGLAFTIFPYSALPKEILSARPRGLIISGGPESDKCRGEIIENVRQLIKKLPILGVSSGHQILAASLGAKIEKMKLGHHGVNYPIYRRSSYKGEITAQNHSYVVNTDSLQKIKGVKITGYNLNDRSVEEMESRKLKLLGVQYYPASPGFNEINDVFRRFIKML